MTKYFLPDIYGRTQSFDMLPSLQREFGRVFGDYDRYWPMTSRMDNNLMPVKFDVAETDKAFELTADVPGVDAKDIDVQVRDGVLTIKGEKKAEKDTEETNYHLVERSYGMFERSFSLPANVVGDKVDASFDKGVLKIMLPKAVEAEAKVQKIAVKAAA